MKRFAFILTVLACLLALTGCSSQESALDSLMETLTERGFTVSVTEDVPLEDAGPNLGAYRIDQLLIGEEHATVFFFRSGEELVKGMAAWRDIAALTDFSALPHLYHTDSLLLLYIGTDESLLAALEELWQPM
ncbi:MAG: hypothetical protein ACOX64_00395 [Candidatus Merdivicinus sp.]|jgi:hypothetical protein